MNQVQLQKFIQEVSKKPISFILCDPADKKWEFLVGRVAWTSPQGELIINETAWNALNTFDKQWIILHEIGHIKDKTSWHHSPVDREFYAQRWAMNKSKALKIKGLYSYIKKVFQMWEYIYEWNSDHRRYILASKLAKRRRII